jgi:hypothetical protein
MTGVITATTDGQIIEDIDLAGCISVQANNVTIRRVRVTAIQTCSGGNGRAADSAINMGNNENRPGRVTGTYIQDVEVIGTHAAGNNSGISAANYTCLRCNVHGFTINLWADEAAIIDSFIHDNNVNNNVGDEDEEAHADGVMGDSGNNVKVFHSWIAMDGGTDSVTAAVNFGGSYGSKNNLWLQRSFLAGFGGKGVHLHPDHTNVVVTDNVFRGTVWGGLWPTGNITWSGNTDESGNPV